MKVIFALFCITIIPVQVFAGRGGGSFGGSRSSSSSYSRPSSSYSRPSSSFGGSRATQNAPIVRPSPPTQYAPTHSTTVINNGGSGGGGGGGFFTGMLLGHMMGGSGNNTTVVAAQPGIDSNGQPVNGVSYQQPTSMWTILFWTVIIVVLGSVCAVVFL